MSNMLHFQVSHLKIPIHYPTPRNALSVRSSVKFFTPSNDTIQWRHCYVRHTAWAPEGREGQSQGGPKCRKVEVGARRAPKLLYTIRIVRWCTRYDFGPLALVRSRPIGRAGKIEPSDWSRLVSRRLPSTHRLLPLYLPLITARLNALAKNVLFFWNHEANMSEP